MDPYLENALSKAKVSNDSEGSEDSGSDGSESEEPVVFRPSFKGKDKEKFKEKREEINMRKSFVFDNLLILIVYKTHGSNVEEARTKEEARV